jgi:transgelin
MPFIQMENISHFLRAIQAHPLNLQPHDVFLTVDLYEAKDPTQVLQCLGAFSRVANTLDPSRFKRSIGQKTRNALSPQGTGTSSGGYGSGFTTIGRGRGASTTSQGSSTFNPVSRPAAAGTLSPSLTGGSSASRSNGGGAISPRESVSSWSKKSDEGATAPAWNIHQYGYMGGASQGNQGITFGARRQITTPAPSIPSLTEKQRRRQEEQAEMERLRIAAEEAEYSRRMEREAEEERKRLEEERLWEEETKRQREKEKREAEEEKRRWEAEERKWKEEEEVRIREENQAEARLEKERQRKRAGSDARLKGQFLSQYQTEQARKSQSGGGEDVEQLQERERIRELERELEKARERERQYRREREQRMRADIASERRAMEEHDFVMRQKEEDQKSRPGSRNRVAESSHHRKDSEDSWQGDEREYLRREWGKHHSEPLVTSSHHPRGQGQAQDASLLPDRPLPDTTPVRVKTNNTGPSSRPLPDPASYISTTNRTDRFLAANQPPSQERPKTHFPSELGFDSAAERHAEDSRREVSTIKTKAGGWASKSLLEREMERERQRQQEWEESQRATQEAAQRGIGQGTKEGQLGEGGAWDINQYGWTGGDSQNRGGVAFGGRRQIIGPRPPP